MLSKPGKADFKWREPERKSVPPVMLNKSVIVCLTEEGGVVWRDLGGSITIHCRPAVDGDASPNQDLLSLKRGLNRNEVFSTAHNLKDSITSKELKGRLEAVGTFPSVDLVLVNLTVEDTGPYWCEFTMLSDTMDTEEGKGAVLLVVKGEPFLHQTPTASPGNSGTSMKIRGLYQSTAPTVT